MKKAIAILLPLALLISAVSCSQKSDNSDPSSSDSQTVADTSAQNESAASSGDTSYTKGALDGDAYVNEYAGIRMKLPEGLHLAADQELKDLSDSSRSYYTDEKNAAFESGIIWDGWLTNEYNIDNVFFRFIDIKKAFPDSSDVTAEDVLEVYKERNSGSEAKYEERKTVTLGGQEYIREIYSFAGSSNDFDPPHFNFMYTRKIDDNLICLISVSTTNPDNSPEYYEGLFS